MRRELLGGIGWVVFASMAGAQPQPMTLTGCVVPADTGDAHAESMTLAYAMVVPGAIAPTSALQAADAAADATDRADAATRKNLRAIGTTGSSAARDARPVAVRGTAPAGSSASGVTGYRLTGADLKPWIGRRVQLVGRVVPSASPQEFRVAAVQATTGSCPKR